MVDTVNDFLEKKKLDVRQARGIMDGEGFVRGNVWGITKGPNSDLNEMAQLWVVMALRNL